MTDLPVCHYKARDHTAFCLNTSAQHSCEEGTLEFSGKQGRVVALVSFHPTLSLRRCSWSRPEKTLCNNETNGARTALRSSLAELPSFVAGLGCLVWEKAEGTRVT